jgi:hypothetical protein
LWGRGATSAHVTTRHDDAHYMREMGGGTVEGSLPSTLP